jgi:hypothetical protein
MENLNRLNLWAILAATVAAFVLGGLWYSPLLFGRAWVRANGFGEAPGPAGGKIFGIGFVLTL